MKDHLIDDHKVNEDESIKLCKWLDTNTYCSIIDYEHGTRKCKKCEKMFEKISYFAMLKYLINDHQIVPTQLIPKG